MTLSAGAVAALTAQQTPSAVLYGVAIDHASLDAPRLFVANTEDIVADGDTYTAAPFQVQLPEQAEGKLPRVQLTIDNVGASVHNDLTSILRSISEPVSVDLFVFFVADPVGAARPIEASIEQGPLRLYTQQALFTEQAIILTLGLEDVLNITIPGLSFTPAIVPGAVQ